VSQHEPSANRREGDADRRANVWIDVEPALGQWQLDRDPHAAAARRLIKGVDNTDEWSAADGGTPVGGITPAAAVEVAARVSGRLI
jgi:hypothetical protein